MLSVFLTDLLTVVRKRVCDVHWEVRDSTMEFLGDLAALSPSNDPAQCASENPLTSSFTPHLVEALQDPESYVRASAIKALAQTFTPGWQQGAPPSREQVGRHKRHNHTVLGVKRYKVTDYSNIFISIIYMVSILKVFYTFFG